MDRQTRIDEFVAYLQEEGYRTRFDDDGDIVFKKEGKSYVIAFDDDEYFFNLLYPNFWSIDDMEEMAKAKEVALQVMRKCKVTKIRIGKEMVSASLEIFSASTENSKQIMDRAFSSMRHAVNEFVEMMRS